MLSPAPALMKFRLSIAGFLREPKIGLTLRRHLRRRQSEVRPNQPSIESLICRARSLIRLHRNPMKGLYLSRARETIPLATAPLSIRQIHFRITVGLSKHFRIPAIF